MNTLTKEKVSDVLKHIKKEPIQYMAICPNFEHLSDWDYYDGSYLIDTFDSYKDDFFKTFSRYSGNIAFPVKSPFEHMTPRDAFSSLVGYWSGQYGEDRKLLLDHLIKCFEEIGE